MILLIVGIIFISVFGTIFHFLYDLSSHNKIVGLFSSVNESTWEHIKILLTPTFIWSLIDGLIYGAGVNYFFAKSISLLFIIIIIPLLFYGYSYIFKKYSFIFDILIFYIVVICSQILFYRLNLINPVNYLVQYLSCIITFIIFGCYLLLTVMPIKNFLFKDPLTNKYGYYGHDVKK